MRVNSGWTTASDSSRFDYDFGIVTLDMKIGDKVGYFGYSSTDFSDGEFVYQRGYPAEDDYTGNEMMYRSFYVYNYVYYNYVYEGYTYTYGGDSGSTIYDSSSIIRAVHSFGYSSYDCPAYSHDLSPTDASIVDTALSSDTASTLSCQLVACFESSCSWDIPSESSKGETETFTYSLVNYGPTSTGSISVSFYASSNTYCSTADEYLGSDTMSSISYNSFSTRSVSVTFPSNIVTGEYFICASWSSSATDYSTDDDMVWMGRMWVEGVDGDDDDSSVLSCFSADTLVSVKSSNGEEIEKRMDELDVGEEVLVLDSSNQLKYSPVIFFPHEKNSHLTSFISLSIANHHLKITPDHLILVSKSCEEQEELGNDSNLVYARDIEIGDCVFVAEKEGTKDIRLEKVEEIKIVSDNQGIITIVTQDGNGMVVANNIISSSFGTSHVLPNSWYHIHRFFYWLNRDWMLDQNNDHSPILQTTLLHLGNWGQKIGNFIFF